MSENLPSRPKLGSLLERAQAITMTQLMRALTMHKSAGIRLGEYLVTYGYITDVQLTRALAEQFDLPVVDLATANIDPFYSKLIPKEYELQHEVLPISYSDGKLTVAIADPTDTKVLRHLETMTGLSLVLVLATQSAIHDAINQVFL
jgi:type IV pilus assembly protein PilB